MRLTDPIADMLTRIRNGTMVKNETVLIPYSNIKLGIAKILLEEGFINNYDVVEDGNKKNIKVNLKYTEQEVSVIKGLKKISKPGRRIYVNSKSIRPVLGGLGNGIISTSHGLKTIKNCINEKIGGEYICQFW